MTEIESDYASEQNIPRVEVLMDVPAYLNELGDISPDEAVRKIEIMYEKYKKMSEQMQAQRMRLMAKLPDLEKSLEMVKFLEEKSESKESFQVTHMLSEQVYRRVQASVPDKVHLWLGSNVMVEFDLNEAEEILQNNLDSAKKAVEKLDKELYYIRDQITTTEVNMARVYNYGVRLKTGTISRET